MSVIGCAIVHHTGTMIRFRTSQLPELPDDDRTLLIDLPDGRSVEGHFRRNPANPNVSGEEVVRYIKDQLNFGDARSMVVDVDAIGARWRLFEIEDALPLAAEARVSKKRVENGALTAADLTKFLERADDLPTEQERRRAYERILRPAGLRRIILGFLGDDCQVEGCTAASDARAAWGDASAGKAVLDVHHVEAVAQRVDHHPTNLCVLCANHHALVHRYGPWTIAHDGDDVLLSRGPRVIRIVRRLGFLR